MPTQTTEEQLSLSKDFRLKAPQRRECHVHTVGQRQPNQNFSLEPFEDPMSQSLAHKTDPIRNNVTCAK